MTAKQVGQRRAFDARRVVLPETCGVGVRWKGLPMDSFHKHFDRGTNCCDRGRITAR